MTTYLEKSCSFCLPRVPFVNCRQFMYLVISLLVLRAGYGIWLYQFLIIAYLFTLSNDYSTYSSVTEMVNNLRWWSLENRHYDARLLMFYKIVYGLDAIPVPPYFERPEVYTRHTHPLAYIQIRTSVCYYQYSFFPMTVVLWNRLPADLILSPDLDSFKAGVRKINHAHP